MSVLKLNKKRSFAQIIPTGEFLQDGCVFDHNGEFVSVEDESKVRGPIPKPDPIPAAGKGRPKKTDASAAPGEAGSAVSNSAPTGSAADGGSAK